MRPHRLYPARLLYPWDSPGKKTGVGCHFLLQDIEFNPGIEPESPTLTGGFFSTSVTWEPFIGFSSVQSLSRVYLLQPHESQHARPPCLSPTPGVHSNSHPSSRWCYPAISSSVVPFSSCPQSLPASESFPMSQLFAWGGQSIGVSASASLVPMNTQDWSPLGWTGWISL